MQHREHPPVDECEDFDELERALKAIVGGPLVRSVNGFADTEHYLATSWLGRIHKHVLETQEETVLHEDTLVHADQRQLLVAIGNRLELDVAALLEAGAETEVKTIYRAIHSFTVP